MDLMIGGRKEKMFRSVEKKTKRKNEKDYIRENVVPSSVE